MRQSLAVLVAVAWMGLACPASAATDSTTFQVTATVVSSCDVSATSLSFGAYDPVATAPLDGAATINVRCTNGTSYVVALDEGVGASATISERRMTNGAQTLTYALYQDAGRSTLWGETSGTDTVAATGTGAVQAHAMYGRAPAQQTATAGGYSDTITVTVTY